MMPPKLGWNEVAAWSALLVLITTSFVLCGISISQSGGDQVRDGDEGEITKPILVLMGDSILDNVYWITDRSLDVEQQTKDAFGGRVHVVQLAVDASRTYDVLKGMKPKSEFVETRRNQNNPYPMDEDGRVYPLERLSAALRRVSPEQTARPTVVLSIGGNDVRDHLDKLSRGAGAVIQELEAAHFMDEYKAIVSRLQDEHECNVLLVFPYQIQNTHPKFYREGKLKGTALLDVYSGLFREISQIAVNRGLPIIDLSMTFDPSNDRHYGTTQIEPGIIGGQFLVDLIRFVMDRFDFGNTASTVFYGTRSHGIRQYKTEQYLYDQAIKQRNKDLKLI